MEVNDLASFNTPHNADVCGVLRCEESECVFRVVYNAAHDTPIHRLPRIPSPLS